MQAAFSRDGYTVHKDDFVNGNPDTEMQKTFPHRLLNPKHEIHISRLS